MSLENLLWYFKMSLNLKKEGLDFIFIKGLVKEICEF